MARLVRLVARVEACWVGDLIGAAALVAMLWMGFLAIGVLQ